ncbi:hypothetical protein B0H10DRAFT_2187856 [Mycena sp. CBHHK59/15]|nr:hypothetical protein B0H10DRAFT_2187856 [Mycena sp. CBHHK59/15]
MPMERGDSGNSGKGDGGRRKGLFKTPTEFPALKLAVHHGRGLGNFKTAISAEDRSQEVGFSRNTTAQKGVRLSGEEPNERRARMAKKSNRGRPEVRGSTRGGPEMNRKTGNGPEVRGTTGGGPEVDRKEDRMKKKTSEGTEFTPSQSRRRDEKLRLSP